MWEFLRAVDVLASIVISILMFSLANGCTYTNKLNVRFATALLQCPLSLPGPPSCLLRKGKGAKGDELLFCNWAMSMCKCRYFLLENTSFVVVRWQTDFLDVDCHHFMLAWSYTSHVCRWSLLTKKGLKILFVSHFSCDGLIYAFLRFFFLYHRPPTPNTFLVEDRRTFWWGNPSSRSSFSPAPFCWL